MFRKMILGLLALVGVAQGIEIAYSETGENLVGHIMIPKNQISQATWIYVRSALEEYKKIKPIFVIVELNTPGGEVFAAQEISDALKDFDTNFGIPCVAFIDNWAISAGAMLAYSCRYIVTAKDGAMGAASPIIMGQGGAEPASEKIHSALRADFANRAAFFDRNPYIAEAMVDKEILLVKRGGEILSVDEIEPGDDVISAKGKLLTLQARQMIEYGVADLLVSPAPGESLLFTAAPFKDIPRVKIIAYQMDWKTRFFAFLAHPMVASLLFLGLMLGFYIEISTPGFGIPGSIALACLFLIALSSFSVAAASWLELIALLVGLGLIAIEVFVIPGFGFVGILGIILAFGGLLAMMLPGLRNVSWEVDTGKLNAAGEVVLERLAWLGGALIIGAVIIFFLSRYVLPKFSRFHPLVLRGEQEGYRAGLDVSTLPAVGSKGIARSTLRPAGKVEIEGKVYDAVSSGNFIEKGTAIKVFRYDGSRMVVE